VKLIHLHYLQEIAKSKSISVAAKRLYVGQTTLSAIVKSMEDELGVKIFSRAPSGVQLTKEGELVLRFADDVLGQYNELLQNFQGNTSPERCVHFLGDASACSYFSVYLTNVLQSQYHQSTMMFHQVERRKMVSQLADGVANIGVTFLDMHSDLTESLEQAAKNGLEHLQLGTDKFYLCVSKENTKFLGRDCVDIQELKDEKYVSPLYYSNIANGSPTADAFRKLNCIASYPTFELVKQAVVSCNYISILTGRCLVNDPFVLNGMLVAIPLTGLPVKNQTEFHMFSRKRSKLNRMEKVVYDALKEFSEQSLDLLCTGEEADSHYPQIQAMPLREN